MSPNQETAFAAILTHLESDGVIEGNILHREHTSDYSLVTVEHVPDDFLYPFRVNTYSVIQCGLYRQEQMVSHARRDKAMCLREAIELADKHVWYVERAIQSFEHLTSGLCAMINEIEYIFKDLAGVELDLRVPSIANFGHTDGNPHCLLLLQGKGFCTLLSLSFKYNEEEGKVEMIHTPLIKIRPFDN